MKYYIIIPAYNEAAYIRQTLQSVAKQTILPSQVVVVNDNSTDDTGNIVSDFIKQYNWLKLVNKTSDNIHMPGIKVIQAFTTGYETIDEDYDIIV